MLHMAPGVSALVFAWYLGPVVKETQQGQHAAGEELGKPTQKRHFSPINLAGPANMPFAILGMSLTWFCSMGVRAIERGGYQPFICG